MLDGHTRKNHPWEFANITHKRKSYKSHLDSKQTPFHFRINIS